MLSTSSRFNLGSRFEMNRKVNISQPKDNHLSGFVMSEKANKWREQHADFIAAYNATVEEQGLPLDEWRSF